MNYTFEDRQVWRNIWRQICEMSYFRKNITNEFIVEEDYELLALIKYTDYDELTLDSVWEEISKQKDPVTGRYIEPMVVPEFTKLHVPYELFYCLGVDSWFKDSFPNCVVSYWEPMPAS